MTDTEDTSSIMNLVEEWVDRGTNNSVPYNKTEFLAALQYELDLLADSHNKTIYKDGYDAFKEGYAAALNTLEERYRE